jgi:hypothetical protein
MRIIFSLIAAAALFVSASSAKAEQFCAPRDRALIQLEKQFEEKVFGRGLAANGKRMIELFVSESSSWTMLVSDPNGLSCIMANGEDWVGLTVLVGDPA